MHADGKKLLNLMFRPGERICVSPNKYGYHCIPLSSALSERVTLIPPDTEKPYEYVHSDELLLVALNPIEGQREDVNCVKYRNFLIEMDTGSLKEQLAYIKSIGMPYSAVIFSGNKSLHFLVSLDRDIPSEKIYRMFSKWILNVATMADQNTVNPSRSIRIPGAYREPGKQQTLEEFTGPVSLEKLTEWLKTKPEAKPKPKEKRKLSQKWNFDNLKPWVPQRLAQGDIGSKLGRNKEWFSIAAEFALASYTEDDTIDMLSQYFTPERDFKEREWKMCIKSAFKYIYNRRQ